MISFTRQTIHNKLHSSGLAVIWRAQTPTLYISVVVRVIEVTKFANLTFRSIARLTILVFLTASHAGLEVSLVVLPIIAVEGTAGIGRETNAQRSIANALAIHSRVGLVALVALQRTRTIFAVPAAGAHPHQKLVDTKRKLFKIG